MNVGLTSELPILPTGIYLFLLAFLLASLVSWFLYCLCILIHDVFTS